MVRRQWIGIWLATVLCAWPVFAGQIINGYDVQYVAIPTANSSPAGITTGPFGDIWFTESGQDRIGHLDSDRVITEFPLPRRVGTVASPGFITTGPDNNLWFGERSAIGRITPSGDITEFPLPTAPAILGNIITGPDGNLWFTEYSPMPRLRVARGQPIDGGNIGRITVNGTVSEFPISYPAYFITRGPDNALWYTTHGIGRITTGGQSSTFDAPPRVLGITAGPDGALWVTTQGPPNLHRITTTGAVTDFPDVALDGIPLIITRGPEDNLWFTTGTGGIWRINLAGTAEEILHLDETTAAVDITVGRDGALWFTQPNANQIGRVASLAFNFLNVPGGAPLGFAHGADDSIWYADAGGNRIGRIGPNGGLLQQELGDGHTPTAVAVDPDGSAWFTNQESNTIGHITIDGDLMQFEIPSPPSSPQDIVRGPDGNYWFTEPDADGIGRITPRGIIKRFPIATPLGAGDARPRVAVDTREPQGIAVGPDNNLWFTEPGVNKIGRMTTSGEVVEFSIPTAGSEPWGIAAGWDGNLYFTENHAGRVARITTQGVVTELGTPNAGSLPEYITLGPDGAMWFTELAANRLGRIARDGRITHFDLPGIDSGPTGIVGRNDGRLFFGIYDLSEVGYVDLAAAEPTRTPTPTVPPGSTPTNTPIGLQGCPSDCNRDGVVTINELIVAANIALGSSPIGSCLNADTDEDGSVQINDLVASVVVALIGCAS